MSKGRNELGVCGLTGESGSFVKSHLIPKALTKGDGLGVPFTEAGRGQRPKVRHSSWYDDRLVTAAGEAVLERLDSWAVRELRRLQLVWSGWGPMTVLSHNKKIPGSDWGTREIKGADGKQLRLFFLSLLWRAAASNRPEFDEVEIPEDHLRTLGDMILIGDPDPTEFYPIQLIQLSTIGQLHNHTPIAVVKTTPSTSESPEYKVPLFRFYVDGLIAHFDRRPIEEIRKYPLEILNVGHGDRLIVTTVPYESSFQRQNLERLMAEARSWEDGNPEAPRL